MKKIFLVLFIAGISLTSYSCRETTQDKTEEAVEAIGDDIEEGTRRAADEIERGAENLEREIDEEIHDDDDIEHEQMENQ